MKINIHAIIYNYTLRYWYVWTFRGPEYKKYRAFLHRKFYWNTCQNKKYLRKRVAWINTQDKGPNGAR